MSDAGQPPFQPESLLHALARADVAYVLIGGMAAIAHGSNLHTNDTDICPHDTEDNAARLASALTELDAALYVSADQPAVRASFDATFLRRQQILNLQTAHGRIDVVWRPEPDYDYERLAARAFTASVAGATVRIAALADLLAMKRAAGRRKDADTIAQLEFLQRNAGEADTDA